MKKNRELIAILRGIPTKDAVRVVNKLTSNGITKVEIPLNSKNPFETIKKIKSDCSDIKSLGAGTVLSIKEVGLAKQAGCDFIFSPNMNKAVIVETKKRNMISVPGIFTPTEALSAIEYGADALKIFPAHLMQPSGLKSLLAVIPKKIPVIVVGGFDIKDMKIWAKNGATGFGIGSYLYNNKYSLKKISDISTKIVKFYDKI